MLNVVIATTMWGKVSKEVGERREAQLKQEFWKDMVAGRCRTERFEDTHASAWHIIGSIMQRNSRANLRIQEEMGAHGKLLHKTEAGIQADIRTKETRKVSMGLMGRFRKWFSR